MTDTTEGAGAPASAAPQAAPITLIHQYVFDLSFENPQAPAIFLGQAPATPQLGLSVDTGFRELGNGQYEIRLYVEAKASAGENAIYLVEVDYRAVAALGPDVKEEMRAPLLLIEGPRLMFPFVRQVAAQVTNLGGYMPLLMQPVDFLTIYRQKVERMQAAGTTPPAGDKTADA